MPSDLPPRLQLRNHDQDTVRVVAILDRNGHVKGAGCLLDHEHVLTCRHVVSAALGIVDSEQGEPLLLGKTLDVVLTGDGSHPVVAVKVTKVGRKSRESDYALLQFVSPYPVDDVPPVEFASPKFHNAKSFLVMGFPDGDKAGKIAVGRLSSLDGKGLVSMDKGGALPVRGGYSGSPVWSHELGAYVGIVVSELFEEGVSWCIPSELLCGFYAALRVRYRVLATDYPSAACQNVHFNAVFFGSSADNNFRSLTASVKKGAESYSVTLFYEFKDGKPRGHYVTFLTYPGFQNEHGMEAYETIAEVHKNDSGSWVAKCELQVKKLFTAAAVGDGGATARTLNLTDLHKLPTSDAQAALPRGPMGLGNDPWCSTDNLAMQLMTRMEQYRQDSQGSILINRTHVKLVLVLGSALSPDHTDKIRSTVRFTVKKQPLHAYTFGVNLSTKYEGNDATEMDNFHGESLVCTLWQDGTLLSNGKTVKMTWLPALGYKYDEERKAMNLVRRVVLLFSPPLRSSNKPYELRIEYQVKNFLPKLSQGEDEYAYVALQGPVREVVIGIYIPDIVQTNYSLFPYQSRPFASIYSDGRNPATAGLAAAHYSPDSPHTGFVLQADNLKQNDKLSIRIKKAMLGAGPTLSL